MLMQMAAPRRALTRALDAITPWWTVDLKPDVQEACWRDDDGTEIFHRTVHFEVEWLSFHVSAWPGVRVGGWADRLIAFNAAPPEPDTPTARFVLGCADGVWLLGLALIVFSVLA